MTTGTTTSPARSTLPPDEEALFREAHRLRRRRWTIGTLVGAVLFGAIAAIVVLTSSDGGAATTPSATTAGVLPSGPFATLKVAGPLAVAADGALYVADVRGERVLVRLPDGRFRVVAGDGKDGFSGDGGPAVRAELSAVSDLVFAPNGALYITDGGRVRVISRNGVIHTIAGDGKPLQAIASGTPALSAALGSTRAIRVGGTPLSIVLSPTTGQLYISTGAQILRLTASGTLDAVRAVVTSGAGNGPLGKGPLNEIGSIAIDAHGKIDATSLDTGWSLWQVAPSGRAHYVSFARLSGGDYAVLQPGPHDTIYASTQQRIVRVAPHRLVPAAYDFGGLMRGQSFPLTYFAVSPSGVYADDLPGNDGFEIHQQLRSINNGHISLLWQENNTTPK